MKIGLEIHVQLPTASKMFCSCPTTGDDVPNSRICPVCLGMPGSKPAINRNAMILGLKLAKLFGCKIPETTWFSRKTYFYPDLCKHYQTTQYDMPVGEGGVFYLGNKPIGITRVHLEEDPGKTKRVGEDSSLVDYNRSGIPLAEIVTEPDLSTPAEARDFLSELLKEIRDVIDLPDNGERSVRCDCNISVAKERCEVKNVTGLKNVENCLKFEMVRQMKTIKSGGKIKRETRRYDEETKTTTSARSKETEADYGYIGEPDLGIYHIRKMADEIVLKESPLKKAERFQREYGLNAKTAKQLASAPSGLSDLFESLCGECDVHTAVKWTEGVISANWKSVVSEDVVPDIVETVGKYHAGKITDTECSIKLKTIMTGSEADSAEENCDSDLTSLVNEIIDANPSLVEDYRGNDKAANSIIGTVIKQTGGKYSSAEVVDAVRKSIELRL